MAHVAGLAPYAPLGGRVDMLTEPAFPRRMAAPVSAETYWGNYLRGRGSHKHRDYVAPALEGPGAISTSSYGICSGKPRDGPLAACRPLT